MGVNAKHIFHRAIFGRWRRPLPLVDGYTILLQIPMDMPFLLRFALEGLRPMNTENCKQILVIPDGWGNDGGKALREVVAASDDPRVELVNLKPGDPILHSEDPDEEVARFGGELDALGDDRRGDRSARTEYVFLHDADAFFVEADALERQYRECRDRSLDTLGVQVRIDEFFTSIAYAIPATWELMYSVRWARKRNPLTLKGLWHSTPHGRHEFDTMLYPQYLDFPTRKIGSMAKPPRLVHFHGAVTTFRVLKDRAQQPVVDVLFRLLLLSILEDLLPSPDGKRILPPPEEVTRGLTDPTAPITYNSDMATREYPIFRKQIEDLCESPTFLGPRADRVRELIRPFDEHYNHQRAMAEAGAAGDPPGTAEFKPRKHWLG